MLRQSSPDDSSAQSPTRKAKLTVTQPADDAGLPPGSFLPELRAGEHLIPQVGHVIAPISISADAAVPNPARKGLCLSL